MFCVTINTPNFALAKEEIVKSELAEIRQDLCQFTHSQLKEISALKKDLIFTFRANSEVSDSIRLAQILKAIELNFDYIDIDIHNDQDFIVQVKNALQTSQCKLIISYHNFNQTPTNQKLYDILLEAGEHEADIIKIVCYSHGARDNERIIALNDLSKKFIAFNMGEKGQVSRAACLLHGAPFTYVAMEGKPVAPGQVDKKTMEAMLDILKNED